MIGKAAPQWCAMSSAATQSATCKIGPLGVLTFVQSRASRRPAAGAAAGGSGGRRSVAGAAARAAARTAAGGRVSGASQADNHQ